MALIKTLLSVNSLTYEDTCLCPLTTVFFLIRNHTIIHYQNIILSFNIFLPTSSWLPLFAVKRLGMRSLIACPLIRDWLALVEDVETGSVSGFGRKLSSILEKYLSDL
ncbi:Root hair defective 3 GTP-binding protein (RHD3) [Euphorbia peplus]|nr:Root hair defective 3 GTP-binding protein (RHD3) [Euphorbia peplus]